MKVMCIQGSPRQSGSTAKVLGWVEDELREGGHEIDHIEVIDHVINGCLGCLNCRNKPDELGCVQGDDVNDIYGRMMDADAIVLSSPLYMWDFSSQVKALLDRGAGLQSGYKTPQHRSLVEGKPISLLVTCHGPEEENADAIKFVFRRWANLVKTPIAGELIVARCTGPDTLGEEVRKRACELARAVVGSG